MTALLPGVDHPPGSNLQHAAVALCATRSGTHSGLLFRKQDGVYLLHLAWHCDLRCDPADQAPQLYWYTPDLTPTQLGALALIAAQIAKRRAANDVTYSTDRSGCFFEPIAGAFVSGGTGTGLTCASFVWALFQGIALNPLKLETWQEDAEDAAFGEWVVQQLTCQLSDQHPHVIGMKGKLHSPRIRPSDIAAAAVTPTSDWPLAFADARATGRQLLQQISG